MSKEAFLTKTAGLLRKLAQENEELRESVSQSAKKARAEKIARKMIEKGMIAESDLETKVKELMQQDLDVVAKALEMGGGTEKVSSFGKLASNMMNEASDPFTAFVMGD